MYIPQEDSIETQEYRGWMYVCVRVCVCFIWCSYEPWNDLCAFTFKKLILKEKATTIMERDFSLKDTFLCFHCFLLILVD